MRPVGSKDNNDLDKEQVVLRVGWRASHVMIAAGRRSQAAPRMRKDRFTLSPDSVASPLVEQRSISAVVRQIGRIISTLRETFKVASAIREKARPTSHKDIRD